MSLCVIIHMPCGLLLLLLAVVDTTGAVEGPPGTRTVSSGAVLTGQAAGRSKDGHTPRAEGTGES